MEPELIALLQSVEQLRSAPVAQECGCPTFRLDPDALAPAAQALKSSPELRFEHLTLLTAVDRGEHIELIYILESDHLGRSVKLKVPLGANNPEAPTLTGVWASANWLEREVYDLFGVHFEGHPDERRLLLLSNFRGHPLLKSFTETDPEELFD